MLDQLFSTENIVLEAALVTAVSGIVGDMIRQRKKLNDKVSEQDVTIGTLTKRVRMLEWRRNQMKRCIRSICETLDAQTGMKHPEIASQLTKLADILDNGKE